MFLLRSVCLSVCLQLTG